MIRYIILLTVTCTSILAFRILGIEEHQPLALSILEIEEHQPLVLNVLDIENQQQLSPVNPDSKLVAQEQDDNSEVKAKKKDKVDHKDEITCKRLMWCCPAGYICNETLIFCSDFKNGRKTRMIRCAS
ncbi:uncharacterized protein [Halyomorpha halys]|uniref:uncharacterized protein n=1 Tax=Halyomorpha halys TaxID=286706 RepID=UPI0006D501DA|nr:uncharacterized protein LOC106691774 [Halyomorpha halys]XP_014293149.1 uncharacterized protein LOC106691774 [Halyomorpha halys]XP_014293150.1 uncharacterized protein LOC106691774 [Halyomorpha halys]